MHTKQSTMLFDAVEWLSARFYHADLFHFIKQKVHSQMSSAANKPA
jgi:hypothetical protein